ncbi:late Golgi vesicles protein [Zygosaccharomyces mellis]|uniref:Late Golgi vesicles protein n=1 Tax=Zygosaccharomyces mellis TaxID=42258 RepID=A0A4C2E604_9SACH|nr:late Golgi vesicles protein [Zygosaccharomyces mellis]
MSETIPPVFFKAANLTIGSLTLLSALSQLRYLIYDFSAFLLALYAIPFSVLIILLEFQAIPALYRYCSFYFSFIGRGFLYILLGLLINFGGVFKVLIAVFTFFSGLVYISFEFLPQIEEPANFRAEGAPLSVNDDDDEII